jgi:tRNA-Thr(GGU) m(6)t(6)A37 methyltransferase TsaA
MEFVMRPIGVIRSPRSEATGWIEVYEEYADGLQDIEGFSHVILLYVFHCSSGYQMLVKPFLDRQLRGLFSTRYPCRPNPIGLSIVELLGREGTRLEIGGVDVLDNTPLLDIKPYVPDFDVRTSASTGWYENRSED